MVSKGFLGTENDRTDEKTWRSATQPILVLFSLIFTILKLPLIFVRDNSFRYASKYSHYSQLVWKWRKRSSTTHTTTARMAADSEGIGLHVSSMCPPIDSSFGFFTVSYHILVDIVFFMYIQRFLGSTEFAGVVVIQFRLVVEHRKRGKEDRGASIQLNFEKAPSSPDRIFRFGRFWFSLIYGLRTCL